MVKSLDISLIKCSILVVYVTITQSLSPSTSSSPELLQANVSHVGTPKTRFKRGVLHLASMITCVAGCDPLSYKGYGCYCGYLGSGVPMDSIDRCCLQHDWCYTRSPCSQLAVYVMPYQWSCVAPGFAHCGVPMFGMNDACSYRLCECDRMLAHCLRQYKCPDVKPVCKTPSMTMFAG
ncbi:Group 10 secretory phospholipase A2 [Halotydeus destructor]|nr:Group 10 secretory phospholipase A2 [Halotydeus destructor]